MLDISYCTKKVLNGFNPHSWRLFIQAILFMMLLGTELEKLNLYEKTNEIYKKTGISKEITNIEFKEKNIILTLNHDINVIFNNQDLDYDMNFLKSILEQIEGKAGTIDMTKENPVFTESIR